MEKDKKLEYLKVILRSNGVKWTGRYLNAEQNAFCKAKTFDEVACKSKKDKAVEIEIHGDVWNRYQLNVNEKQLEVVRFDMHDNCILNVTPIFKLGRAWERAFKNAMDVNLD